MKKKLSILSLLLLFTMTAMAQTLVDGIYYNLNGSDNTAEVTRRPLYSGDIVIPASISVGGVDYSVTSIGESAFSQCDGLTSIEIPNSVTEIGKYAFVFCDGLTSIVIPSSVTSIGESAFSQCDGLTSIEIPNSVTEIGDYAFSHCSGLTSIVVEEGNSYYDSRENCNALIETTSNTLLAGCQNTVIPNSVTSIEKSAFSDCSSLTSIEIPTSVTEIGERAFEACRSLTSIEIPNSVTSIEKSAFSDCSSLTSIEIPNSVTEIGSWAFYNCSGLTSIKIPNSVTEIGEYAFSSCSGLTSIDIPNSVTEIGEYAFLYCFGLTSIVVEEGNSYYDSRENCNAIIETASNKLIAGCQNTVIPNSVTEIGDYAFYYCDGLTSIEIPNSVTSIGDYAFLYCSNLTSITMQRATPPTVGDGLFNYCSKLETIYVPAGAAEAYNVAPWNAYNIVELIPNYEPRHNGTKTRIDRPVTAVKLIGESSGEQIYSLTFTEQYQDFTDVTASVVFQVEPGEKLTPKVEHNAAWMNHAVYIDTDANGFTGAIEAGSEWKPAGDLVSYSFYNNSAASDESGWNSIGDVLTGDYRNNPPLPAFSAPTEPGIYRMRFVQDWCSIDPAGDDDGKYGDFKDNGGQIVDVMLEVLNHVYLTDGEAYTNATEKETERITYTRNFNNTQWQAWYVPFDIDYDAISEDFTAASLNAVHQYDDNDDGVFERWTLEILKLKSGDVIRANMPYMIRAKETGEHKFVVENAILYPAEENSLDCSSIRVHYTFKGNYSLMDGQVLRDNGWFAPGGGSLVTPSAGSNLKAYRWLLMPEARGGYETFFAPKRINIVIGDEEGELTAIEEVPLTFSELWPADVYDLNGRLVKAQAENLDNLPKGIYLVNGKKIVK